VTRIISHQFVVGLAFESLNFGGRRAREAHGAKSVFY